MFGRNALQRHCTRACKQVLRPTVRFSSSFSIRNARAPLRDINREPPQEKEKAFDPWEILPVEHKTSGGSGVQPPVSPPEELHLLDWKKELSYLRSSPDAETLAVVIKGINFRHPGEVRELLRDWSDVLGEMQDPDAWDMIYHKMSILGSEGLRAVWEGFVQCGDRGFARREAPAIFLFKCSLLIYDLPNGMPWMVQQYRQNLLPSPFRTNSPSSGDALFGLWDRSATHDHKYLTTLWLDMLGPSAQLPGLLQGLWSSVPPSSELSETLLCRLNGDACFEILEHIRQTHDLNYHLYLIDICTRILEIDDHAIMSKNQVKIATVILNVCRESVGFSTRIDHGEDPEFKLRQANFLPIIERVEVLVRSCQLEQMSDIILSRMMAAYSICHRHDKVVQIWREIRTHNMESNREVSMLLASCGFQSDSATAVSTWSELRQEGFPLDEYSWTAYIECLGRCREWKTVLDLICVKMKNREGNPPAPYPTTVHLAKAYGLWRRQMNVDSSPLRQADVKKTFQHEFRELFREAQDVRWQHSGNDQPRRRRR